MITLNMNKVYNLKRTGKKQMSIQYALPVFFAYRLEGFIHRKYAHKRIRDVSKTKYKFWDRHTKIGVSNNPKRRLFEINKSKLKSGHTESFDLNLFDRLVIFLIIFTWSIAPLLLITLFAFLYILLK